MAYQIENTLWQNVFAVPGKIVDEHLKLCGGASLKALLFLLRHGGDAGAREVASFLGLPLADAIDAINYWIHLGVVKTMQEDADKTAVPMPASREPAPEARPHPRAGLVYTLAPAMQALFPGEADKAHDIVSETVGGSPEETRAPAPAAKPGIARNRLTTRQINEMSTSDQNVAYLLQEAQSVLGKPLTPVATDTVTALYSYYGMQPDMILVLLQYCLSIGRDNMRYIEKVAATWIETGVDTHEKAEREILLAGQRSTAEYKIRRLLGIHDRALTSGELEHIRKWTEEMRCSPELIGLAFERTVDQKGRLSFAYLGGILKNWHAKGIATKEQALLDMQKGKGQKSPGSAASSYDIHELEHLVRYGEV